MRRISLATDFSAESEGAFILALGLAAAFRARLDLLNVMQPGEAAAWNSFPHVRQTLEHWGMLPPQSRQEDVGNILGIDINKVEIQGEDAASAISAFVEHHRPDLMVAASHGRTGLNGWLSGSVALATLQKTALPTLLLGPAARPFVDRHTGLLTLDSVLFPVALSPSPLEAIGTFRELIGAAAVETRFIHISEDQRSDEAIRTIIPEATIIGGKVVPGILDAARKTAAQLIVMPTAGRHGFMDALRGSTTQRVLHEASCPVLALPS